jgi:hypothetical protein
LEVGEGKSGFQKVESGLGLMEAGLAEAAWWERVRGLMGGGGEVRNHMGGGGW